MTNLCPLDLEDEGAIHLDRISVQDLLDDFINAEWRDSTILEHLRNVITLRRQHLGVPYGYGEYQTPAN